MAYITPFILLYSLIVIVIFASFIFRHRVVVVVVAISLPHRRHTIIIILYANNVLMIMIIPVSMPIFDPVNVPHVFHPCNRHKHPIYYHHQTIHRQ